jgi:hypothetical protein
MNWNKCPCCGNPCETLFISVDCISPSCQNYSKATLAKYEIISAQKNNSMSNPSENYDEDYGYPMYGYWYQQDTD